MRHKKLLLFLAFLFGSAALSYAQQIPLMSQYYFNDYLYNPSRAGASISPNAFFGYRNQWTGLKGAPQTNIFAIDMMIPKHYSGLGFKIYQDKIHISERTNVMLSYSYHAVLSKNQVLSFGLSAGASSLRVNLSDLDNTLLDPNDPILAAYAGNENSMGFEADFGIHYRLGHLHVGVSVPQIYTSGIQYETNKATTQYNFVRHNLISAKYSFHFNEVHKLEPLLMLRSAQGIPAQWDFGGVYTYDNMVWGGIHYLQGAICNIDFSRFPFTRKI